MILLDYIFYFFCNLYRLSKDERESGDFKISGTVAVGGTLSILLLQTVIFIDDKYATLFLENKIKVIAIFLIAIFLFIIRYYIFTSYERINKRIKNLSRTSILLLNIFLYTYLTIIIGGLLYMFYIGFTDPIAKRGLSA